MAYQGPDEDWEDGYEPVRSYSYPMQNEPSTMHKRYTTGIPEPRWGVLRQDSFGSDCPGAAQQHDAFRGHARDNRPPADSPFKLQTEDYHQKGTRAREDRTMYWNYTNPDPEQVPEDQRQYQRRSMQYAHEAAWSTRKEIDSRREMAERFAGYDEYERHRGHNRRIEVLEDKEREMLQYKHDHRDQLHSLDEDEEQDDDQESVSMDMSSSSSDDEDEHDGGNDGYDDDDDDDDEYYY